MSWLRVHLARVAPLLLAVGGLLALHDLEARPWATVLVVGAAVAAFALALSHLGDSAPPASAVLTVAALLRICLLPLPATLSDDVYRYLWDGQIASAGRNPYFHAPDDPSLRDLRDEGWERVAHREVETVYPPLAIAAFSIAARSSHSVLAWKAMLATVDLLSCALLLRLARVRGVPAGRCLAYAWNPLVVIEVAGMGHVDALGVLPLVVGALCLVEPWRDGAAPWRDRPLRAHEPEGAGRSLEQRSTDAAIARRRSLAAGAALALAILAKLAPVLLVPAWTRAAPRRGLFLLACTGLVAVGAAPFAIGAPGLPPGLVTYGLSWEWNGPVFEPLWRGLDAAGAAPWIKERLDHVKQLTGRHELVNRLYPYVYPQLLAKALLALAICGLVVASLRRTDPVAAALLVFAGILVLSPTVYPWYALWMLPWASLLWRLPWLVLSLALLSSYLPRLFDIPLLPWPFSMVWAPFLIALFVAGRTAARSRARCTA